VGEQKGDMYYIRFIRIYNGVQASIIEDEQNVLEEGLKKGMVEMRVR
jgi:hypothetical protein